MIQRFLSALILFMLVAAAACRASESYLDKTPTWSGSLAGKTTGHATVECDHPSRGTNARLHAGGLTPNGAYVVLYTDYDGKEKPLGTGNGQAKADSHGWLDYSSRLAQCPLGDKIKVTLRYQNPPSPAQEVLTGVLVQQ